MVFIPLLDRANQLVKWSTAEIRVTLNLSLSTIWKNWCAAKIRGKSDLPFTAI